MIIATMILSDKPELFLPPCLESVKNAVDLLVVNDNSGRDSHENLDILKSCSLYKEGKVALIQTKFEGFDKARNQYLDYIKKAGLENSWLLKLDADEVHAKSLEVLTREILPSVPSYIDVVDVLFYQFMQSFDYIYSIDRRHNFLTKYNPDLYWEGAVHEQLRGMNQKRILAPFVFFHYGYVSFKKDVLDKWKLYAECGDKSFDQLEQVELKHFLNWEARLCFKFKKEHPLAMQELLKEIKTKRAEEFESYHKVIRDCQKKNFLKFKNYLREINYNLKVSLETLKFKLRFLFNKKIRKAISHINQVL